MRLLTAAIVASIVMQSGVAVTGVVVDGVTQLPVADARVLLARVDGALTTSVATIVNDRGQFAVRDMPPGRYRVFATRDGYLRGESDAPIVVEAGRSVAPLSVTLTPTAVISGRVVNEFGDPVPRLYVRAWAPRLVAEARTNDLGEYRLFDLGPGSYVISAERYTAPYINGDRYQIPTPPCPDCMGEGAGMIGLTNLFSTAGYIDPRALTSETSKVVFYPGTTDRTAAAPVEVRAGAHVPNIDLRLTVKAP